MNIDNLMASFTDREIVWLNDELHEFHKVTGILPDNSKIRSLIDKVKEIMPSIHNIHWVSIIESAIAEETAKRFKSYYINSQRYEEY